MFVSSSRRVPHSAQSWDRMYVEETPRRHNEFKVKVYPNPASSNIIIGYESQTEGVFKLFNGLGDILISTTLSKDNTKTQIRIDGIANGVYLYEIEFAGMKRTIGKITIIK